MHVEDTTRFCPKEERESKQTSFRIKTPDQTKRGIFTSTNHSFRKSFKNGNLQQHSYPGTQPVASAMCV
uniref:Uncharacterized protein n=1 Tax=Neovison vison TaxID=452646 RepID=A0A8C7B2J7_NEOVI